MDLRSGVDKIPSLSSAYEDTLPFRIPGGQGGERSPASTTTALISLLVITFLSEGMPKKGDVGQPPSPTVAPNSGVSLVGQASSRPGAGQNGNVVVRCVPRTSLTLRHTNRWKHRKRSIRRRHSLSSMTKSDDTTEFSIPDPNGDKRCQTLCIPRRRQRLMAQNGTPNKKLTVNLRIIVSGTPYTRGKSSPVSGNETTLKRRGAASRHSNNYCRCKQKSLSSKMFAACALLLAILIGTTISLQGFYSAYKRPEILSPEGRGTSFVLRHRLPAAPSEPYMAASDSERRPSWDSSAASERGSFAAAGLSGGAASAGDDWSRPVTPAPTTTKPHTLPIDPGAQPSVQAHLPFLPDGDVCDKGTPTDDEHVPLTLGEPSEFAEIPSSAGGDEQQGREDASNQDSSSRSSGSQPYLSACDQRSWCSLPPSEDGDETSPSVYYTPVETPEVDPTSVELLVRWLEDVATHQGNKYTAT